MVSQVLPPVWAMVFNRLGARQPGKRGENPHLYALECRR